MGGIRQGLYFEQGLGEVIGDPHLLPVYQYSFGVSCVAFDQRYASYIV